MRNRIIGLLAAGLAVSFAGCGEVEETGYLALTQVSGIAIDDDGCGEPDDKVVPSSAYDAGVGLLDGSEYLLGLWLRNSLVANDDTDGTSTGRINTNRVQVDRIEVRFTDRERWGFLPERREVGMPFMVDSEATLGWPTRLLPLDVVRLLVENPESPIRQLDSDWVSLPIEIKAIGKLLDGTAVESNTFSLTLSVCNRCSGGCPEGEVYDTICSRAQPGYYTCKEAEAETPAP